MEVRLDQTRHKFVIHERDRKSVDLVSVQVLRAEEALQVNVVDEKELVCFSKSLKAQVMPHEQKLFPIKKSFQVINHLSISITTEGENDDFEVVVTIE